MNTVYTIDGLSVSPGGSAVTVEAGCETEVLVALGTARVDDGIGIITRERRKTIQELSLANISLFQ